jgi:ribose 5-phosphate isomerase B
VRIAVGSDHAGLELKETVKRALEADGHQVADLGTYSPDSSDYPDYAFKVGEAVARGDAERGVLVCNTGIGMSIAANKVTGVRASLVVDEQTARLTRQDNDSNVITLGRVTTAPERAASLVRLWLATPFSGSERHERRVKSIEDYEQRPART